MATEIALSVLGHCTLIYFTLKTKFTNSFVEITNSIWHPFFKLKILRVHAPSHDKIYITSHDKSNFCLCGLEAISLVYTFGKFYHIRPQIYSWWMMLYTTTGATLNGSKISNSLQHVYRIRKSSCVVQSHTLNEFFFFLTELTILKQN